ncbi:MAG: hypothetical protein MI674_06890, partial [Cytophagales bacterium]|nr:hypothetical protein [Cytophagales bacterium]
HKEKLIKVEAALMEEWLAKNRDQPIGGLTARTHEDLLNVYLFVIILQRALNERQVDLSSYAGMAQNLEAGSFQDSFRKIQRALNDYQHYREKGDEGKANKAREKLNGLLAKWLENNEREKIIVLHDLLELTPQEIARLKEERAKAPVRETLAWGVDTVREGLRGGVDVTFDSVIIPISQWAAIYTTSQIVGRSLPIIRHIPYANTAIGAAVVYPFRWFIKKPVDLAMKIPRDQLSEGIGDTTRSIFTMLSGALDTVSNVSGKVGQLMVNPGGGVQSVTIGDVEQGKVKGKEDPSQEAPRREMSGQDFIDQVKFKDIVFCEEVFRDALEHRVSADSDEGGEVFHDALEHRVSDEEYEECYGTPAADKEGKAVTPSREGDSMGPKAGGRGVSVGEVKSTRRASSWLYRLLKTLGIYSSS